ncbi:glycine cleavage system aminomethyltransferase GcvT [Thermocrinis minervae]|uniref:aminomethyltransferase n=1 Tax=Thermocrinis minervae TaxID=381751 RepID=A0A1M6RQB4_9AQUI|nr:glycine cleavage system aminomethyltransferase GcvT [Thermocrinis minervae]SHK34633.1 aminomethyltransferase [Thermocrinis minervae]
MKTPFYSIHKDIGARFTDFNGWQMPLDYGSVKDEVLAVRQSCGIFDVSHMGRFLVRGYEALQKLNYLTTNNLQKLKVGKVQYNLITNEKGGIKDDITVYMLSEDELLLCVNAGNRQKVKEHLSNFVEVLDISQNLLQIAVQGKESPEVISKFFPVKDLKYYHFKRMDDFIVSRTGYTGGPGYEIYGPVDRTLQLFRELLNYARPCGLAARDVLRIEAGFPLYGKELSEDITPLEAALDKFVDFEKDFLGKQAMLSKKVEKKLFGLELLERGVPRSGYRVLHEGKPIGVVSSGTYSYTLDRGIALCFVDVNFRQEGLEVEVEVRDRRLKGRLRSYPFVKA